MRCHAALSERRLHLQASQNRMQVNRIASAYGKDNTPAAFAAWTKQDLLRYVADTKNPIWYDS